MPKFHVCKAEPRVYEVTAANEKQAVQVVASGGGQPVADEGGGAVTLWSKEVPASTGWMAAEIKEKRP